MTLTEQQLPERLRRPKTRGRTPFAAVPLEPWSAEYPGSEGVPYADASLEHIKQRLDENFIDALERGVLKKDYRLRDIYEFTKVSLEDAQYRRINFNNAHALPANLYPAEEYINAALEGTATPEELLRLMLEHDLPSIELAKLSHPFDFSATRDMNTAVLSAQVAHGFELAKDPQTRYKAKRIDWVLGALIAVRKDVVGHMQLDDEKVEVVSRQSLLILDGEESSLVNSFLTAAGTQLENGKFPKPNAVLDDFSDFITAMHDSPMRDELTWLFPTTTSYYVRRTKD